MRHSLAKIALLMPANALLNRAIKTRCPVLKAIENRIKRLLNYFGQKLKKIQKSRSECRGGFPLLSTPFQDERPSGRHILMFNLPFVKDCYAKVSNFFIYGRNVYFFLRIRHYKCCNIFSIKREKPVKIIWCCVKKGIRIKCH